MTLSYLIRMRLVVDVVFEVKKLGLDVKQPVF